MRRLKQCYEAVEWRLSDTSSINSSTASNELEEYRRHLNRDDDSDRESESKSSYHDDEGEDSAQVVDDVDTSSVEDIDDDEL